MEGAQATTRPRPRRGDELELTIDRLAYGGAGVARTETGYVVFVRGAVPGDRVRARIGKSKRSWAEAELVELLEPSPERVEPVAPHPGAPWQVLPYERQLEEKEFQVRDALSRIGGFEDPPVEPIVPAEQLLRYRNKLEYSFGMDESGELVLGFHRAGPLRPDRRRGGRHPRLRAHQRGARGGEGVVPRGGPHGVGPRDADRRAPQPRGSRGPPHAARSRPA